MKTHVFFAGRGAGRVVIDQSFAQLRHAAPEGFIRLVDGDNVSFTNLRFVKKIVECSGRDTSQPNKVVVQDLITEAIDAFNSDDRDGLEIALTELAALVS